MEVTYFWILYSCLIFGSGILCDRRLKRRQAVSSCSVNTEDNFFCSNGPCIEWSWVCDGHMDCSDGSDETKELCARYEYGNNVTMDCGRVNIKSQVIFEEGKNKATVGTTPWFAAIFKLNKTNSNYYLDSVGSIIAPNVVISAASSFWHKGMLSKRISIKDGQYKITVGKYDKSFTDIDNDFIQIIDVETIYLSEGYDVDENGVHSEDISVIILANKISFSNGIAPVCIDWYGKYNNIQSGAEGKISLWGDTKNGTEKSILVERLFPYINPSTCRKLYYDDQYVTSDKFCAGSVLGPPVDDDSYGAGISYLHSNSYFLTGVLAFRYTNSKKSISGFTGIKYYVQWIRGILNKHVTMNSCLLPIVEGVVYSYEGSNEILSHGTVINRHQNIIENCEFGYHKAYPKSVRFCLGHGKWLSNSEKLCFKMCPPLESDSLDIKCSHNGEYSNCSNLSVPETIATPTCKQTYAAPNGQEETPVELHCLPNGMWNKQLYRCHPYCGRVYIKNQVLINNGDKALVGTAPWNVGIYQLNANSNYDLICGGSIIAPNLVISAAHCFWRKGMLSKRISINDGLYKIAVGKYERNFTIIDNDFTQIMNVEMIHLREGYYGPSGFHAEDIAVMVLKNRISFSNGVAPVCIDWNGKYNVFNGDRGKVVGWGKTEKGIQSSTLLEASLPYIDHSSCRNMYTNGFEPFVTVDKFCAGSSLVSGQGVDVGDSGAGLCFFHSDSYYLTGVVSIKDPNTNNSIAAFTEVKYHVQWIRQLYNKHN